MRAVPATTTAAVLAEAAADVLVRVAHLLPRTALPTYVVPPRDDCDPSNECLQLAPLLGTDPLVTGHLHRASPSSSTLELVGTRPQRDPHRAQLQAIGHLIAIAVDRDLIDVELARSDHKVRHLEYALESNRAIGIAIGILMTTTHCTEQQAFELMKCVSQNENRKLRDIACDVRYTGALPTDTPGRNGRS